MQARWGTHGDHPVIVLAVSTVADCFEITVRSFNLSERYRIPVVILSDEVVSHTREIFTFPSPRDIEIVDRMSPSVPPEWYVPYENNSTGIPDMAAFGEGYRYHITGLVHDERGFPTQRPEEIDAFTTRLFRKLTQGLHEIQIVKTFMMNDADVAVIAYGSVSRAARRAVLGARSAGTRAGLLQLITLFPFPEHLVEKVLNQCTRVLVPEMNMGQIYREIKRVNQGKTRVKKYNRIDGQFITPDEILRELLIEE